MVLPALALHDVVRESVCETERRNEMPRADATAPRGAGERHEDAEGDRDPRVPAVDAPRRPTAEPRVERDQVPGDDVAPGGEAAHGGEPAQHHERRHRGGGDEHGGGAGGGREAARARRGDGHDGGERAGEERRVRLHRDAGAEGGARPQQADNAATLEPARHAERAQEQEETQQEIALARLPGAAGEVVGHEDERAGGGGHPSPRQGKDRDDAGGGREPPEVEDAPREVAAAERAQHGQMEEVGARLVHVEQVPVRDGAVGDPPRDVVHEGNVVDQRPRQRAPREQHGEAAEAGEKQRASDRSRLQ